MWSQGTTPGDGREGRHCRAERHAQGCTGSLWQRRGLIHQLGLPDLSAASVIVRGHITLHPVPSPTTHPRTHCNRHRQSLEVEGKAAEVAQIQLCTTSFPPVTEGGTRGRRRAGPSSSSSSSLALCARARQMGGPASSVATAPSKPSFICQPITPCSHPPPHCLPTHRHTCPSLLAAPGRHRPHSIPREMASGTPRPGEGRMASWRRDRGCQIT